MVNKLGLTTNEITNVEFKKNVWFPNDASLFFKDFKSEIILFK